MKKLLIALSVILLFALGLGAYYLSWNNIRMDKAKQNIKELTVTVENASSTNAVLRFKHPDPKILTKYSILDDCTFILKKTSDPIEVLKEFDPIESNEAMPLVLSSDSSAVCEKNWEHLYGELEPGEYAMGILITQKGFFSDRAFGPLFVDIEIPKIETQN